MKKQIKTRPARSRKPTGKSAPIPTRVPVQDRNVLDRRGSYFHWVVTFEGTLNRAHLKYVLMAIVTLVLGLVLGDNFVNEVVNGVGGK